MMPCLYFLHGTWESRPRRGYQEEKSRQKTSKRIMRHWEIYSLFIALHPWCRVPWCTSSFRWLFPRGGLIAIPVKPKWINKSQKPEVCMASSRSGNEENRKEIATILTCTALCETELSSVRGTIRKSSTRRSGVWYEVWVWFALYRLCKPISLKPDYSQSTEQVQQSVIHALLSTINSLSMYRI